MNPEKKSQYINLFNRTPHQLFEASLVDPRPICILDTNIILDLWVFNDSRVEPVRQAIDSEKIRLIGHIETFCELADVLSRPMFKLTQDQQDAVLMHWLNSVQIISQPFTGLHFCKDADDDKFFELAILTQAQYLVSKDKKVLKARGKMKKQGTLLLDPEGFSKALLLLTH